MTTPLLPSGFSDLTPPLAKTRRVMMASLLSAFDEAGFGETFPAMMEFEDSLCQGTGDHYGKTVFRAVDPLSHKTLALRGDMTMQVARIAGTLLKKEARPLRLSYGGTNLRMKADTLDTRRQVTQVGLESFGTHEVAEDARVINTVIDGLQRIQPDAAFTLALSLPSLTNALLKSCDPAHAHTLSEAIARKSVSQLEAAGYGDYRALLLFSGPCDEGVQLLTRYQKDSTTLSDTIETCLAMLDALTSALKNTKLRITLDPLDSSGYGYHTDLSFALLMEGFHRELGRGGRYISPYGDPATGLTVYLDDLIEHTATKG